MDLNARLSDLKGVGDIGYAVTPLSELELLDDISTDSETTAEVGEQVDIVADSSTIAESELGRQESASAVCTSRLRRSLQDITSTVAINFPAMSLSLFLWISVRMTWLRG
jgi:hypothetical protein